MPVVLDLPEHTLPRHLSKLPYDAPKSDTCSASAVSVGESAVIETFVLPSRVASVDVAVYEFPFLKRRQQEEVLSVTAPLLISSEEFAARSIPSKNLKAIELLEQWFSRPGRVPREKWQEFDQIIAEGRSFSF